MAFQSLYRPFKYRFKWIAVRFAVSSFTILLGCGTHSADSSQRDSRGNSELSINVASVTFPDTTVGTISPPQTITITNTGSVNASIAALNVEGPYRATGPSCIGVLAPKVICTMSLSFVPQQPGSSKGTLTLISDGKSPSIPLVGIGAAVLDTLAISAAAAYVREGGSTQLSASLNGAPIDNKQVIWQSDVDLISPEGVYTAATARSGSTVSITATLASARDVHASFSLPVGRALPQMNRSTPETIAPGGSQTVVMTGTNLANVSVLTINGRPSAFTRPSDSEISFQVSTNMWDAGALTVAGNMSGYDAGTSNAFAIPITVPPVSFDAAARLLQQAAYGATLAGVTQIQTLGMSNWIDQQIQTPAYDYTTDAGRSVGQYYRNTLNLKYSLRQRVAFALWQIYVTGNDNVCEAAACGPYWEATLEKDAFGNARDLLRDVALSPIMGAYLNNVNNPGYYQAVPNQNFARELMQLMTIGTVLLNQDGTPTLDSNGKTTPTYSQNNIVAMTNALTGWRYPLPSYNLLDMAMIPMAMVDGWHNQDAKTILPGVTLPAAQGGQNDFDSVINALFNHSNYGPFLCRRLIQHLVTSNPSPAYVGRISSVFSDDGSGTRGNLAVVVKAILLDPEARKGDDPSSDESGSGHYMEPILYIANVTNAVNGGYTDDQVRSIDLALGQPLYGPPSVFSYYSPDHQLSSGEYAPEVQLLNGATGIAKLGIIYNALHNLAGGIQIDLKVSPFWDCSSPEEFLERANHLLYHGKMPAEIRNALTEYMSENTSVPLNTLLPDLILLAVSNTAYQTIH